MLDVGEALFAVTIPAGFTRDLLRGDRPQLLVEADATDPVATGNALGALGTLPGPGARARPARARWASSPRTSPPSTCASTAATTRKGSPATTSCPGLVGTILTLTMVIMTALAVTRERERGTMENLLAMPVTPLEVMIGKMLPFIGVGLSRWR